MPAVADNDTIYVDFINGFDTLWTKTALKKDKNLIYANCGIVNDVLQDGVSAFWYSDVKLETEFKFGDKLTQTDTVPPFGAFDYDAEKIKRKLAGEYQWFVESYGDKYLIVRLRMFNRGNHGRLLLFKSGLLPTSLTHEHPLEVYFDQVHTTMGVSQVYRIEPDSVPDILRVQVESGSSIYVDVEFKQGSNYAMIEKNAVATKSSAFEIDLRDAQDAHLPVYVTVRRGTPNNVSKLKLVKVAAPDDVIPYDTTYTTVDTVACSGTNIEIDGQVYSRDTKVTIYSEPQPVDGGFHVDATIYNIIFQSIPRVMDTVYVKSFPYLSEQGTVIASKQGWKNVSKPADNVCGSVIYSTYYTIDPNAEPDPDYEIVVKRLSIDTVMCHGQEFELEGAIYTTNGEANTTLRDTINDTLYIYVISYKLSFVPQPTVTDTILVRTFPATHDGVTASAEGLYSKAVPADNPCGQILYNYYFAKPQIDTVQRITIDSLSCLGSVVRIGDDAFLTDTMFTLYTEVQVGKRIEVSAITYNLEFEEQPIHYDTTYVVTFPTTVEGHRVTEEGWLRIEKPIDSPCLTEVFNHYVVIDESRQWGKTCDDAMPFEYGYDKWINDTLWVLVNVQELIDNGISAYWNPIYDIDSLEIAVFLDCETAPVEKRRISFDHFYHISPNEIQNRYLDALKSKGIDISTIPYVGVRFVPFGTGELIALKSGEYSDHYVIHEDRVTDTVCQGRVYLINGVPYSESVNVTVSKRETNSLGTRTDVYTTVYNITFVPSTIEYETVYIDELPYTTEDGTLITRNGQMVVNWLQDDSPCGWYQLHVIYQLYDAISINEMDVVITPNYAEVGQPISITAAGTNNLQVFDVTGRQIINTQFAESTSINLMQRGEYLVRITNANAVGVQKVIIK